MNEDGKEIQNPRIRTHQNTYRLRSEKPFEASKVKTHMKNIMELNLKETEYSDKTAKDLCLAVVEEIKAEIKNENFDRYKIVVTVAIGEKKMHGVEARHAFLWDAAEDRFVGHYYESNNLFCEAVAYCVRYD